MDLTACFQTLIQLICEVVCQINQSLNWLTPDRELVLSSIPICNGFSVFLSCHHGLCFCFETQEPLTSFSCDVHFDQLRSQMLGSTGVPLSMTVLVVSGENGNTGSKGIFWKAGYMQEFWPSSKLLVPSCTCCCSCQSRVVVCCGRGSCC